MYVNLYVGGRRLGWCSSYALQVLAKDWAPVLGEAPLFHTTSPHKADPDVLQAALPELRAALQRMESLGYHGISPRPIPRLDEPPKPTWLYDNLFRIVAVFEDAIRLGLPVFIQDSLAATASHRPRP